MSEIQLQSKIAVEFSQRFPIQRGKFFHVSNERNSKIQAFQARSIGIFPGVADFLYFKECMVEDYQIQNVVKLIAIEVKEKGSSHKLDHIRQQWEWGVILEDAGGKYVVVTSVEQAMEAVNENFENCISLQELKIKIDDCKTKTITF